MLKLKRFSSGQWFDYPKASGVRLLIRPLQLSSGLSIRSKIRGTIPTDVKDPKTQKSVTVLMEDVDTGRFSWEIFDYMLVDFEGIQIEGEDGKTIEVSKSELKIAIFDDTNLRDFVSEKSEWLRDNGAQKLEDEVKNSASSQSG